MSKHFHDLKISSIEPLTEDAVAISLQPSDELGDEFNFVPGQYLTFLAKIDGEELRRSYSICNTPEKGLRVGIKKVEGGRFSNWAQTLETGSVLQVMPPEGRFTYDAKGEANKTLLLIAAGSGITPILSIAASALEVDGQTHVTLIYGNQRTDSIMFREEIEDLKDRFIERFHVHHVLSREAQDVELLHGRVDVDRITQLNEKGLIAPLEADGIYLCGPAEMTLSVADWLKETGVDKARIHTELFEVPGEERPIDISSETRKAVEEGVSIDVVLDGITKSFTIEDANDTVLSAAEKAGLDLPFSCAGGMCATCRCKLVEGEADMDRNYSLDDWEVEAGYMLACQTRPKSKRLVLDFDEV